MKKIKEKIKEFKAKPKKEKIRKIVDIIFLGILIIILAILMIGFFVAREDKRKMANASDTRSVQQRASLNEYTNILYSLEVGKTAYTNLSAGSIAEWPLYQCIMMITGASGTYPINVTTARVMTSGTEIRLYMNGGTSDYCRLIFNISNQSQNPYGYTLRQIIGPSDVREGKLYIGLIYNTNESRKEFANLLWQWSSNPYIDDILMGQQVSPEQLQEQYNKGYNSGYNKGYANGVVDGETHFSPVSMIIDPVAKVFSTPLFGEFSIGSFFVTAMFVSVALMFLKIFAGG